MGLFSQAARTYDLIMDEIGQKDSNAENLAPIFHKSSKIGIAVQITFEGELRNISPLDNSSGFIPITEASAGRTSTTVAPHPLVDDIKNLTTPANVEAYLEYLEKWCTFDPENSAISAVYKYMKKKTLADDLRINGIALVDKENKPSKETIGWIIQAQGRNIETWNDLEIIKSYTSFLYNEIKEKDLVFCMISGRRETQISKIPSLPVISKLISSNDKDNFSYRGRFINSEDALTTGYIPALKAVNVLSWLISDEKYCITLGESCRVLCWRPKGLEVEQSLEKPLFNFEEIESTVSFPSYKKIIDDYIKAKISEVPVDKRDVITVILNATSTGRGSIKFYSEFTLEDFLDAMAKWDLDCCWLQQGKKIISPSLFDLSLYSFGTFNPNKGFDGDKKNKPLWNSYALLIERRIKNGKIPVEIINNLVSRCEKLNVYIGTKADKNTNIVNKLLFTTCAALRKYYIDKEKKEYGMGLDKDSTDRSYQWGRLLAVFEKIEIDALADEKSTESKRVTNATRMQSMFIRRPEYTASILNEKMRTAYYSRFTGEKAGFLVRHEKLISEILEKLSNIPEGETDKPLKSSYLFGYYLQKNDFYKKSEENK